LLAAALVERKRNPPTLQFWDDGTGYRLTIYRLRTREVIERFADPSLADAALPGVQWPYADLEGVNLDGADLQGAVLCGSNLSGTDLRRANLRGADLSHAALLNTRLIGASLIGADLRGADFVGRGMGRVLWYDDLDRADLRGARYNAATRWPARFDPVHRGCVLADEEPGLPIPAESPQCEVESLPLPVTEPMGSLLEGTSR